MTDVSREPYVLITADTHAGGSHAQYREYLDPKYRDAFDSWRGGYKNPSQQHYARKKLRNWDYAVRTEDQNSQGVVGEVIFPNTVPPFYRKSIVTAQPPRPEEFEHALAGIRAHNRWLKDFCADDPVRRAGIGLILPNDLDEAIKDIEWIAEAGLRGGVLLPLVPPDCTWAEAALRSGLGSRARRHPGSRPRDQSAFGAGVAGLRRGARARSALDLRSHLLLPGGLAPPAHERSLREVSQAQVRADGVGAAPGSRPRLPSSTAFTWVSKPAPSAR